jgi:acyl-CoA thioesterase
MTPRTAEHDLSRSRARELHAHDLTCHALGIRLGAVRPGRASVRMRVTDAMVNGHGIAHGGYLFLLADAAFAFASNTHGPVALAQEAQISFLRPATAGDELLAEAVERTRHGRVGIYDVTVRRTGHTRARAEMEIVAEFRGQSTLLPGGRSPIAKESPHV